MSGVRGNRRQLLQGTGGLIVGLGLGGQAMASQDDRAVPERDLTGNVVDSWLEIDESGAVTLYVGKVELGTGIQTALGQIAAEELDVAFERVTVVQGDTALTPDQGYTAGSKSIQVAGPLVRRAAAQARAILLGRAAERLGVPVDEVRVRDGVVQVGDDAGKSVRYGELVDRPFAEAIGGDAAVEDA